MICSYPSFFFYGQVYVVMLACGWWYVVILAYLISKPCICSYAGLWLVICSYPSFVLLLPGICSYAGFVFLFWHQGSTNASTLCLDMVLCPPGCFKKNFLPAFPFCSSSLRLVFPYAGFPFLFVFGLQIVIMPKAKSTRCTAISTAPAKRSSPRASVQANSAAVLAVPARTQRSTQVEAIAVASDPAGPTHSNGPVQPMLSPQFMERLITRVADEVSRRLSPVDVSSTPSPSALSTLQEVPVSSPVGQNTAEVASTVVQQSLANASTTLTGSDPPSFSI